MPYVVNALIDSYASLAEGVVDARRLFDALGSGRTAASWTSMIAGYARWGQERTGLRLFKTMLKQLHLQCIKKALDVNLAVVNSLIDMYCTCARILDARSLFDGTPERNLITWNTMIAGYSQCDPLMALQLLLEMNDEPNCFTLTSITSACADLAALRCGKQVHGAVLRRSYSDDLQMGNALVDMYSKCGSITNAKNVFDRMGCKDKFSWTSMIAGYGMNGYGNEAVQLFSSMIHAGVHPDHVVFLSLISSCSHAGLEDEGWNFFRSMINEYNLQPNKEVYGSVVNLLARAGRLREALDLIDTMPFAPDEYVWGALLGASKMHNNVEMGRLAARKITEINPDDVKNYIMLASIYAAGSKWGEYAFTRRSLRGIGSRKEAGISWIEVMDKMYSFTAADSSSPQVCLADEVLHILSQHMDDVGSEFCHIIFKAT
uniref:Pentatricopeptide repeat-containing protein n=1 Tax=Oryza barthii TaxID=65489 RepID=A0A0D3EMW5_9ORYZ